MKVLHFTRDPYYYSFSLRRTFSQRKFQFWILISPLYSESRVQNLNRFCASFQYKHSCANACRRHFCPSSNSSADVTYCGRRGSTWNDDFGWTWTYSAQQLAEIRKCRLCPLTFNIGQRVSLSRYLPNGELYSLMPVNQSSNGLLCPGGMA